MAHKYYIGDSLEMFKIERILSSSNISKEDKRFIMDAFVKISKSADLLGEFQKKMDCYFRDLNDQVELMSNDITK